MNKRTPRAWPGGWAPTALALLLSQLAVGSAGAAVAIGSAGLSAQGVLTVKGTADAGASVELLDLNGRRLGSVKGPSFTLTVPKNQLANAPCAVRAESAGKEAVLAVTGAPAACAQPPTCSISVPASDTKLTVGVATVFQAQVTGKSTAVPLTYQWDFAGGSMDRPTGTLAKYGTVKNTATFVRNNSSYRVRFIATDKLGRRCEDAVQVAVGTAPTGMPAKVTERPASTFGAELDGTLGDVVVMPYEEWSYQNLSDMKLIPNGYGSFSPTVNNVRAYAFRKDRLPIFLSDSDVELRYSAASNPADPVGIGSINSTSRNYPATATLATAKVKKTDAWEIPTRPDAQKAKGYFACSWMMTGYWGAYGCGDSQGLPTADEGYFKAKKDGGKVVSDDPNTNLSHGAYMPGKSSPYKANTPQPFSKFVATEASRIPGGFDQPASWFEANMIPVTDIDDKGRVNPYPLLRIEAVDKASKAVVAKTDGVASASRDFHCRECHAKGGVAANPNAPYTKKAFASSAWGKWATAAAKNPKFSGTYAPRYLVQDDQIPQKPDFFDVSDFGGDPNSVSDQEYAAALNYSSLHQYYDVISFLNDMLYAQEIFWLTDAQKSNPTNIAKDTPRPCYGCHATAIAFEPFKNSWWDEEGFKVNNPIYAPNYSISMHRWHGEMQWNANKTDIVRDANGAHKRWDWKTKGANNSTKTGSLFPIFDSNGKQLPMEENCLKCHAGHREQLYRDEMFNAGVTCYDCHGDMLAMGEAFPKNYLQNKAKVGSTERDDYRVPWFDEPDCGSCHVGDGNQGQDKLNGFFSAGVMKRAFEDGDLSATTRPVDWNDANSARFSAAPLQNFQAAIPTSFYYDLVQTTDEWLEKTVDTKVDSALYRYGKDRHGNVACAACHGAAHSVWSNADPSANDNVTSLQLQGHTGTIHECNVCHTADAFKKQGDLDGGTYSGDTKSGILGGPHNTHPINDPYWWKAALGDTPTTSGGTKGGWHNNYAKKPGKNGEDQCAACHGQDHLGTRLSKTPVDREFVDEKGKTVKVLAGTEIGCNLCHTVAKSCIGSPAKTQCGKSAAREPAIQASTE
jgi:hypothetical protein